MKFHGPHKLLKKSVAQSGTTYGPELVANKVHGLVHLSADAMAYGCLDSFRAFQRKKELKTIKWPVRKMEVSPPQVVKTFVRAK